MTMSKHLTKLTAHCRILYSLTFLLFTIHFSLFTATAQTATATLRGTVVDANGASVPGASVTITDTAKGFERKVTTDDEGSFTLPLLQPSNYILIVARDGFASSQVENVILNVGDQKAIRVELKVSPLKDEVVVTPDAPLVDTSPAVSTTIGRDLAGRLPLNGRSFQSLILLTPGVTVATSGTNDAGQFSVNGQRGSTNVFLVDGVSANVGLISVTASGSTSNAISGSLAGSYPATNAFGGTNNLVSQDALQEFKIQTSTTSAEFGRQPGAQVSLVTRSGENKLHGNAFEYFRNEALDARNYFNKEPAPKTPLRQNQFGGTFSGPIVLPAFGDEGADWYLGRDRSFFFFSYEGQILRVPSLGGAFVPSERLRLRVPTVLQPILAAFPGPTEPETTTTATCSQPPPPQPPDPTCAPNGRRYSGVARATHSISNPGSMDATSVRIDHRLTDRHLLYGRYNFSPSNSTRFSGGAFGTDTVTKTQTLTFALTSVFNSKLINDFRINFSEHDSNLVRVPATYGGAIPIDGSILTNGFDGVGQITVIGFGAAVVGGDSEKHRQRSMNIVDTFTLLRGRHQLKFGVDYRRLTPTFGPQDIQTVTFSNEAALMNLIATSVSIQSIDSARPTFQNISVFGQDTWKVSPRLTLDFGLRYELNPTPSEADGKIPPVVTGIGEDLDVTEATLAPIGTSFYKTFYTAFAPRFGVAYQLRKRKGGETILRGGIGVYYDLGATGATRGYPFTGTKNLTNVPFPLSDSAVERPPVVVNATLPLSVAVFANAENLRLPYSMQWNVTVEQAVGAKQAISVAYVAQSSEQLLNQQTLNRPINNIANGPRPNPNFREILYVFNGPTSDYHSMQVHYKARFVNRLSTVVNYTWSHAIDEISADLEGISLRRGNASFDVRHNFSAAFAFDIPSPFRSSRWKYVFRGWALDGIIHLQTGRPIDIFSNSITIVDGLVVNLRPNLVLGQPLYIKDATVPGGRRFNTAAFSPPIPNPSAPNAPFQGNFGRNVLRELPLQQMDLALSRTFSLSESLRFQLKGEMFNVLNHPMFGNYDVNSSSSTFGVPGTTLNTSLGGQSGLYQLGGPRSIQLSARLSF